MAQKASSDEGLCLEMILRCLIVHELSSSSDDVVRFSYPGSELQCKSGLKLKHSG